MTSELEQKFYDTFGIEKVKDFNYCNGGIIEYYLKYPDITAEKLIQIFLVLNQWYDWRYGVDIEAENVEDFKKEVLQKCIDAYNKGWVAYNGFEPKNTGLYEDIQQLFKDYQ